MNSCFFAFFVSRDIDKIWMLAEPLVICQIHQGFPLPKPHIIYIVYNYIKLKNGIMMPFDCLDRLYVSIPNCNAIIILRIMGHRKH